jgi:short-subunit dehydrogenase
LLYANHAVLPIFKAQRTGHIVNISIAPMQSEDVAAAIAYGVTSRRE